MTALLWSLAQKLIPSITSPDPKKSISPFKVLPKELVMHLFSFLDSRSCLQLGKTCKEAGLSLDEKRYVILHRTQLNLPAIHFIGPNLTSQTIKSLDLSNSATTNEQLSDFTKRFPQITNLNLTNCRTLTGDGFLSVNELTNLTSLNLTDTRIGDEALTSLSIPRLQNLNLSGCLVLTHQGLENIGRWNQLSDLDLSFIPVTDVGAANLERMDSLRHLSLRCARITRTGLASLRNLSLTSLKLNVNYFSGEDVEIITTLTRLKHLSLAAIPNISRAFPHLARLRQLESLVLNDCTGRISRNDLASINHVTEIEIEECDVESAFIIGAYGVIAPR